MRGYESDLSYVRRVNREYRTKDDSHLFPILGKFNVTERAILRLRRMRKDGYVVDDYEAALDDEISRIVNDERNW